MIRAPARHRPLSSERRPWSRTHSYPYEAALHLLSSLRSHGTTPRIRSSVSCHATKARLEHQTLRMKPSWQR